MLARDLAKLAYGNADTTGLKYLLRRHAVDLLAIRSIGHDERQLLVATFHLHKKDGSTLFATYKHFLLAAMLAGNVLDGSRLQFAPSVMPSL
jgi:hypothetical protein